MYIQDTIVAPATAPGRGAVAIVRLSGPDAIRILRVIWKREGDSDEIESRRLYIGDVVDPATGAHIDRALAVAMPAPASLTGEDVAEIQCHGGPYIVRRIVAIAIDAGARAAEPGEFTRRTFLNGKIDLTEAEAIADLVEAKSEAALKNALEHISGGLKTKVDDLRGELISIRAHLEAEIDFSDEDIALPSREEIVAALARLGREIATLHDSFARGRIEREGVRATIIGKPNVGKSSILNLILGTDRAIVTPIAGTTRDIIEDSVQLGPHALVIQDTAGIRAHAGEVEQIGIARTLKSVGEADLVIAVFDSSRPLNAEDVRIADRCAGRTGIALLNKTDLPALASEGELRALGITMPILPICAIRVEDAERIRSELSHTIQTFVDSRGVADGAAISRERHRDMLASALRAIENASAALETKSPPEIIAVDVTEACDALGQITGAVHSEDILDAVFREFCIGK